MKKLIAAAALVGCLGWTGVAAAEPYDDDTSHPLRMAAYLLHPIGFGIEQVIFRPFYMLVTANDTTKRVFGHNPKGSSNHKSTDELPLPEVTSGLP